MLVLVTLHCYKDMSVILTLTLSEFFLFILVPLYKVFLVTLCFIQAKTLCIRLSFVLSVLLKWCPDEIAYKQYKFW